MTSFNQNHMDVDTMLAWYAVVQDARKQGCYVQGFLYHEEPLKDHWLEDPRSVACMGYLMQWAVLVPEEYARFVQGVAWRNMPQTGVGHPDGLALLQSIVHNGIMDDWQIGLQWDEKYGFLLAPWDDDQITPQQLFNFDTAPAWLHMRVGGPLHPKDVMTDEIQWDLWNRTIASVTVPVPNLTPG